MELFVKHLLDQIPIPFKMTTALLSLTSRSLNTDFTSGQIWIDVMSIVQSRLIRVEATRVIKWRKRPLIGQMQEFSVGNMAENWHFLYRTRMKNVSLQFSDKAMKKLVYLFWRYLRRSNFLKVFEGGQILPFSILFCLNNDFSSNANWVKLSLTLTTKKTVYLMFHPKFRNDALFSYIFLRSFF